MPRRYQARCECCKLPHQFVDRIGETPRDLVCTPCRQHRGEGLAQKRTADHEVVLREALTVASKYAQRTEQVNGDLKERTASALRSRDRAVRILRDINDLHVLRPNGSCSCNGRKGCKTAELLYGRWIQDMIRRADETDTREERYRAELAIFDDDDSGWVADVATPPMPEQRHRDQA